MLLLIDGDVIAYMSCKPRWQEKSPYINGSYIASLDDEGKIIQPEFTDEENQKYLEESWNNFKEILNGLLAKFYTNDYLMSVKGEDNFRDTIYSEYKLNRRVDKKIGQMFVPILRRKAVMEGLAIPADGGEADDYLRIWAEQCKLERRDYVVATIDKDLRMIPGKYYNLKKDELEVIPEIEAKRHYYEQLLKGDPTDNIPGLPKVGDVRAKNLLKDCTTEEEMQEIVISKYIEAFEDDWESWLLSNGKMIHLARHPNDYFRLDEWEIMKELR